MHWVGLRWLLPAGVLLAVGIIALACGDDDGLPARIGQVKFRGEVTSGLTDNTLRVAVEEVREGRAAALSQLLDCSTVTVDIAIADLEGGLPQEGDSVEVEGTLLDSCTVDAVEVEIKGVPAPAPVRTAQVEFSGDVTTDLTDNVMTVAIGEIEEGNVVALRELLDCGTVEVDISGAALEGGLPRSGDRVDVKGSLILDSCTVNARDVEIKG